MKNFIDSLRAFFRVLLFVLMALTYFSVSLWIHITSADEINRRRRFSKNGRFYCWLMCKLVNIQLKIINPPPPDKVGMFVGNHMGFVDIFSIASMMPNLFVTSKEMHETPVIGLITEFAGCVYVDRKNRANILQELEDMVQYLRLGFRVVLFPEATSHNGEKILPFKRTLMTAAAYAGVPLIPFVFNFKKINDEPFSKKYQDSVCFYGDLPFHTSIWKTFKLRKIECELEFFSEVRTTPDDDRAQVADRIRQIVVDKFLPIS